MRTVKAAAVQISPVLYSREGTVDKVVRQILDLGQQGVQFLAPYGSQAALLVARDLDTKIEGLLETAAR